MTRQVAAAVLGCALVLWLGSDVRGAHVGDPLQGYSLASWAEREGVPLGPVYVLAQDRGGYLWLGTESGLIRFDGVRFLTTDELGIAGLPAGTVRALLVDSRDGTLWVGLARDGGLWAIAQGTGTMEPMQHLDGVAVTELAQEPGGRLWAGGADGLYTSDGHGFERAGAPDAPREAIRHLEIDQHGMLHVAAADGLYERLADGTFRRMAGTDQPVRGLSRGRDGVWWTTHPTRGFARLGEAPEADHDFEGIGTGVHHDSRGNLWVTTRGQGLWRVYRETAGGPLITEKASVDIGLLSDGIWSVLEDVDGNIWVGTHESLHRLMPHRVTPVTDLGLVRAVAPRRDGGMWIGTAGGLLSAVRGHAGRVTLSTPLDVGDVLALATDTAGTVWMATSEGLLRLDDDGAPRAVPDGYGTLRDVTSLAAGADGAVWVADATDGLFRIDGGRMDAVELGDGVGPSGVTLVHEDRAGTLWLTLADGRIAARDPHGQVHVVAGSERGGPTSTLAEAPDGTMWATRAGGLARIRHGQLEALGEHLPTRRVDALGFGSTGEACATVERAILCFETSALDTAFASPESTLPHRRFITAHGLAGVPLNLVSTNSAATGDDGALWFVTGRGVTIVDPVAARTATWTMNGPVHVESLTADGNRLAASDAVTVPAGTTRLQIDYTALQLSTASTPRFRYRLEGVDPAWVDAGTQRQTVYTNLDPGQYRFVVQAEGEDGAWTGAPATLAFNVQPVFYQTSLFYALITIALAGMGWLAWNARVRIVEQQFSLALAERARLGREMHDTLLQSLAGFALQLDGVANTEGAVTSETRERLLRMRRQVEGYVRDVRKSIWDLRSPTLQTVDLGRSLREAGTLLVRGEAAFHLTVHGNTRPLGEQVDRNLLHIGQEAITNAARHGAASRIEAELRYGSDEVVLRVADDGRGFEIGTAHRPAHYGMVTMRERAKEIDGTCTIRSTVGKGTIVEVRVPAPAGRR